MSEWVRACAVGDVDREDIIPFEHDGCQYAVYCSPEGTHYATDGWCTHESALLADGLVMGHIIECPKHNGRFDYRTGEGMRAPIRTPLRTYPVRVVDGSIEVDIR